MSVTRTIPAHLASMTHVLAPGVLSGGYKNQSNSALAHQTGLYMTGGEGTIVVAFLVVIFVVAFIAAAVIALFN